VLVGALHLAIDRWNTSRGKASRSVNVTMPRNVRPAAWSSEICSNIWTGTGVVTDPAQRDGLAATIAAVSEQTRAARQVDHGANLHEVLQSAARTPERVLHLIQVLSRGQESGVLSSLGAMTSQELSFGPHDRVEVWFVPVAGDPLAGVALGAVTVDDQLHLGMRYPARQFNRDAAEEFFDHYVAVLEP
jgi:NRPS condensation-like uncharacterized protein